jgi:hypothetical protein
MKTPPFNTSPDIPVGTKVRYYPVSWERDFIESVTRTPAWLPHAEADYHYVSIEGKSGGLLLSHIEIIET